LIFLVLVLDAPGGGDAPAGVTGMREATPSGGDPTKQVRVEPAAGSLQSQTPPPDPAGGLGEMLTLPGTVQRTPSSNPVDQEPGAYYWGPTSQDAEMGKQQGDAWPGDGQGAAYWGPVGDSTVEGVSTIRQ